MRKTLATLVAILALLGPAQTARGADDGPLVLEAPGREAPERQASTRYRSAIARQRVDDDMIYYDPVRPAPVLNPDRRAESMVDQPEGDTLGLPARDFWTAVLVLVLVAVVFFVIRFGPRLNVALSSPKEGRREKGRRSKAHRTETKEWGDWAPTGLEKIAAMADRREALVALAQAVLARALDANGLLLGRSWTMRDALARIPRSWPHRDRLASLALASEVAHFGGREVSEEAFQAHFAEAAAILKADAA